MKIDALSGGLVTLKNGMNARCRESQVLKPTTLGCSSKIAHRPKMMLGMAAARSTRAMSERRLRRGAYSLRKRAVAMATGAPTIMATVATSTVPTSEANTPNVGLWPSVLNPDRVKKPDPRHPERGEALVDEEEADGGQQHEYTETGDLHAPPVDAVRASRTPGWA